MHSVELVQQIGNFTCDGALSSLRWAPSPHYSLLLPILWVSPLSLHLLLLLDKLIPINRAWVSPFSSLDRSLLTFYRVSKIDSSIPIAGCWTSQDTTFILDMSNFVPPPLAHVSNELFSSFFTKSTLRSRCSQLFALYASGTWMGCLVLHHFYHVPYILFISGLVNTSSTLFMISTSPRRISLDFTSALASVLFYSSTYNSLYIWRHLALILPEGLSISPVPSVISSFHHQSPLWPLTFPIVSWPSPKSCFVEGFERPST